MINLAKPETYPNRIKVKPSRSGNGFEFGKTYTFYRDESSLKGTMYYTLIQKEDKRLKRFELIDNLLNGSEDQPSVHLWDNNGWFEQAAGHFIHVED